MRYVQTIEHGRHVYQSGPFATEWEAMHYLDRHKDGRHWVVSRTKHWLKEPLNNEAESLRVRPV